jgi:hypothetical protein
MSNQVLSLSGNKGSVVVFWPPNWGEMDRVEKEGNLRCLFAVNCGAYKRAKEIQTA